MRIEALLIRQKHNNKKAFIQGLNSITYKEWFLESEKIKLKIEELIDSNSKCVVLFFENSINYAVAYMGALLCDKVVVPIGIQAKGCEIIATLQYCEVDLIITDSKHYRSLSAFLKEYKYKLKIIIIDTMVVDTLNASREWIRKEGKESLEDVAIMLHTSGTLSNPKRVMLTHENLISNIESNIKCLDYNKEDISLIALPMYFGYCNTAQFLTHLYLGAMMVIMETIFFPKTFFELVEKYKITNFTGVPSMLLMLLKYQYSDRYDISSLRYICFGGGTMPIDSLRVLINRYVTVGFVQTYGQTECSPRVTALMPKDSLDKLGSVGLEIPGVQINIVDEQENSVNTDEIGEIVVRGANIMKGYYKNAELTKEVIRNGWLHTGDLGYRDRDGYLYIKGRKKNLIISGGINIYPEEIEQVIRDFDNVEDVYVYGELDYMLGEVPVAQIVSKNIDLKLLRKYCKENLSNYKLPVRFYIVDTIEKTYNGKIKRENKLG